MMGTSAAPARTCLRCWSMRRLWSDLGRPRRGRLWSPNLELSSLRELMRCGPTDLLGTRRRRSADSPVPRWQSRVHNLKRHPDSGRMACPRPPTHLAPCRRDTLRADVPHLHHVCELRRHAQATRYRLCQLFLQGERSPIRAELVELVSCLAKDGIPRTRTAPARFVNRPESHRRPRQHHGRLSRERRPD